MWRRMTPDMALTSLAPTRSSLIAKGMIWRPNHGDTAYTVPMFDEFMKRILPGADWRHVQAWSPPDTPRLVCRA